MSGDNYAGDWLCSEDCSGIWGALNSRVAAGPTPLDTPDYTLQLMRGRDTSRTPIAEATNDAIDTAQQVRQSFNRPATLNVTSLHGKSVQPCFVLAVRPWQCWTQLHLVCLHTIAITITAHIVLKRKLTRLHSPFQCITSLD